MQHDNMPRLFVYGTLMPGHVNHHYLQTLEGEWQQASVKGLLYPEGIGLAQGYPALVLDEHADDVPGWVLTSSQLQSHWPILDEFEGFAYRRLTTLIVARDNTVLEAYVYVLSGDENL
jgi:gamma-glutamylcyclotransferase (GGCT)/AIG2-like uncharacterized protein YtfP